MFALSDPCSVVISNSSSKNVECEDMPGHDAIQINWTSFIVLCAWYVHVGCNVGPMMIKREQHLTSDYLQRLSKVTFN